MRAERSARFVPDAILYACSLCFFFRVQQHHLGQTKKRKEFSICFLSVPSIDLLHFSSIFCTFGIRDLSTPLKKKKKREEKERERSSSSQKNQTEKFFSVFLFTFERDPPGRTPDRTRAHAHRETEREREREREREKRGRALI